MQNKAIELPLYVSTSDTLKGIRCIRAARDLNVGELIESCPVILIPIQQLDDHDKTILTNYNYDWDKDNDAFVLGYCVLTNHSFDANATYRRNYETKRIEYIVVKKIKKDEEIFVNYNGKPDDKTPLEYSYHTDFKL
jgi:hypothetical protein